ncbi:MAG: ATP-binding protein, partial [Dermatophilaceae bacterium]|nr:ATP-binding protein [Dermatophilaceae bacterium]
LAELEHGADCDTAELLTAELVANAVEHTAVGDCAIELVIELLPSGCQVEVHDTDPAPPFDLTWPGTEPPDPWQEHGRGLLLIRALSSSCGHRPTTSGKAVWFRLPVVPRQRRSA